MTSIDVNDLLMDALISGPVSLSSRAVEIKVAGYSFQHFSRLRV